MKPRTCRKALAPALLALLLSPPHASPFLDDARPAVPPPREPAGGRAFRAAEGPAGNETLLRRTGMRAEDPAPAATVVRFANGEALDGRERKEGEDRGARYWVVHFEGPVRDAWRRAIEAGGARPLGYLPENALLVRASGTVPGALVSAPGVDWVRPLEARHKIALPLLGARAPEEVAEVAILLHDGENARAFADSLAAAGVGITERADGIVVARARPAEVEAIASREEVRWIEPYRLPRFLNHDCQWVVQTDVSGLRSVWQRGLRGDGILVGLCDSGIRASHQMFRDNDRSIVSFGDFPDHRKIVSYTRASDSPLILFGDDPGAFYHGTHTSCTVAGNDTTLGSSGADGVAPGARLFFVDAGGTSNVVYVPADLADLYEIVYAGNEAGAPRILSNSWGVLGGGAYDFRCELTDRFVWEHDDLLLVFSNGNAGAPNSVASPAASKNCIGAGGTENGSQSNQIYAATSRGPTDDGRTKPTVCAPARLSSASGAGDASFQTLDGTSMAAPSIAASAALARQYFLEGRYPTGSAGASPPLSPSAALLRATLVNAAISDVSGFTIPSSDIGWGRVRLEDVLYFPGDSRRLAAVDEAAGLLTGETARYEVTVASSAEPLEITLVWSDYPSSPAASRNLVNDLDLVVRRGAGAYLGNVFAGGASSTGGTRDSLNVEECVRVSGPAAGTWEIEVAARAVPFGPQPYALVVTGALDPGAGSIAFERGSYGGEDTLRLRLVDPDAVSPALLLSSDTEAEPETLALAGSGGVFEGGVPTSRTEPARGDGLLSVSHGDSIRAEYHDLSAGAIRRAAATAWLRGPVLFPPGAASPDDASAVVRWETDVPSDSRVILAPIGSGSADTVFSADLVLAHEIAIEGLLPETTYVFSVSSADYRGNRTSDDGGAAGYRFTTGRRADVLVVVTDPTFEKGDTYRLALRRFGWNGRIAAGVLPPLGDREVGLRSHPAVWWQCGWEEYPPFSDEARARIGAYLAGGGRLAVVSHDVAWAFGDPASPYFSAENEEWLEENLKATFAGEPSYWTIDFGAANDSISGAYAISGVPYTPFRSGGAGDEIHRSGAPAAIDSVWSDNSGRGMIGLRWEAGSASGDPDSAVWGGTANRGVTYCFEWTQINASYEDDNARANVLDKSLRWLIGRDHPDVVLTTLAGGGTIVSSPAMVRWNETARGGIGARRIEWSADGGGSWNPIASNAGPSPFAWDLAGVPNAATVRVRVTVVDAGSPPLAGTDASDSDFTIAIPGNDGRGPCVIAGSAVVSPDPVPRPGPAAIRASISDSLRGGSAVSAAEWSLAPETPPGAGIPMSGPFGSVTIAASDTIDSELLAPPLDTIWIRGRDAAGAWGEPHPLAVHLRGDFAGVASAPAVFRLHPNAPNPFNPITTVSFDLTDAAPTRLLVYDVSGRAVRTLVDAPLGPGAHRATWDGRDARGREAGSGVYLLLLESGARRATRKMVLLR